MNTHDFAAMQWLAALGTPGFEPRSWHLEDNETHSKHAITWAHSRIECPNIKHPTVTITSSPHLDDFENYQMCDWCGHEFIDAGNTKTVAHQINVFYRKYLWATQVGDPTQVTCETPALHGLLVTYVTDRLGNNIQPMEVLPTLKLAETAAADAINKARAEHPLDLEQALADARLLGTKAIIKRMAAGDLADDHWSRRLCGDWCNALQDINNGAGASAQVRHSAQQYAGTVLVDKALTILEAALKQVQHQQTYFVASGLLSQTNDWQCDARASLIDLGIKTSNRYRTTGFGELPASILFWINDGEWATGRTDIKTLRCEHRHLVPEQWEMAFALWTEARLENINGIYIDPEVAITAASGL